MEKSKIYESCLFEGITGDTLRPGGFNLTKKAMEFCSFRKGSHLLDLGCGKGATVEYIHDNYGYNCTGIDLSLILIAEGLKKNPYGNLVVGSCEKLSFEDSCMDGVMAECSFSLMKNKEAVLNEAKRVLRSHGKLIISDIYSRNQERNQIYNDISIETCILDAFLEDELKELLATCGFKVLLFEDYTNLLKELMCTIIMEYGSVKHFWEMIAGESIDCEKLNCAVTGLKPGYFLCIAELP